MSVLNKFLPIFCLILILCRFSWAATLDSDGGYIFTIAIEQGKAEPDNSTEFLKSIENAIRGLNHTMWESTGIFHIKGVEIVLPNSWKIAATVEETKTAYHTADVRVSENARKTKVENKNQCGRPGEYIEVPLSFFNRNSAPDDPDEGAYGSHSKSLLHLWARYRWGVWEEHGHPGDYRFPYFYKENPDDGPDLWKTTGCSDATIDGILEDLANPNNATNCENTEDPYPPHSTCRFHPNMTSGSQSALSSLMHWPWIETVEKFCDSTTHQHNIHAPNRHNLFCGYKSTMDIIEMCEDRKNVNVSDVSTADLDVRITRSSNHPLLFILLDNGYHLIPPHQFVLVKSALRELLDMTPGRTPESTLVKIDLFEPLMPPWPWRSLKENFVPLDRYLNDHNPPPTLAKRNFPTAIKNALLEINSLSPVEGGVLVILKNGAKHQFDEFGVDEQELVSIVKGRPVKIFTVEIEESQLTPRINLETVTRESGGRHLKLTRNSDIFTEVKALVDEAVGLLAKVAVDVTNKDYVLFKQIVNANNDINLPEFRPTLLPLRIVLTTKAMISPEDVSVNPDGPDLIFESSKEWKEAGSRSKNVLSATLLTLDKEFTTLNYKCDETLEDPADCKGLLVIFGEEAETNDIRIRVSTSLSGNVQPLDMTPTPDQLDIVSHFPVSIFAEILQKDVPLKGLQKTYAFITHEHDPPGTGTKILLRNNGLAPDLFPDDGVYSGVFVPEPDKVGRYFVSVSLEYHPESIFADDESQEVRLVPIDQVDATCGGEGACDADPPTKTLIRHWDLLDSFVVTDTGTPPFVAVPVPILDLRYDTHNETNATLEWTAPYIIGEASGMIPVDEYILCKATSRQNMLDLVRVCETIDDMTPKLPGEREIYIERPEQEIVMYYAIISVFSTGRESLLSNIIGVYHQYVSEPTTTTTTQRPTTTEPPPSASHGYDITVAIEDGMTPPEDPEDFIETLRTQFDTLSEKMFEKTSKRFYINSVEVIVPHDWSLADFNTTTKSFKTADIRISTKFESPRVENPNPCGLPGNYMEVPFSILNDTDTRYGDTWKVLLHEWARYRWGVWEEHGYIGSSKFPYFYKRFGDGDWKATGCSNPTMDGDIKNSNGETCEKGGEYPPNDCRFYPDLPSKSQSSLMYLHWVDSVEEFCNANTHEKETPNKQNLFCRHRSTSEVISRSLDLDEEFDLIPDIPKIDLTVSKTTPKPLLYILLDDGQNPIAEDEFAPIRSMLTDLLTKAELTHTKITIGKFPTTQYQFEGSYVEEHIRWKNYATEDFDEVIQSYPSRTLAFRDFGLALHETINKIKKLKLPTGAVILMVKTGVAPNTLHKISYEEEILAALKESNIKIFALELRGSALRPQIHLQDVVIKSGGVHMVVENAAGVPHTEGAFIRGIVSELRKSEVERHSASRIMYKGEISSDAGLHIRIAAREYSSLDVYLTSLMGNIQAENVEIELEYCREFKLKSKREWAMTDEMIGRETIYGTRVATNLGPSADFKVSFNCTTAPAPCKGFLVLEGVLKTPPDDLDPEPINVLISTSTSALKPYVLPPNPVDPEGICFLPHLGLKDVADLSQDRQSTTPYGVFVKVEEFGRPLRNVEKVEATFYFPDKSAFWTIPLTDDGLGTPDTFQYDGIYSGNFIPPADGTYNMYVFVSHAKFEDKVEDFRQKSYPAEVVDDGEFDFENVESRLLPIDETNFTGCSIGQCNGRNPSYNFARVVEYAEPIVFCNSRLWTGKVVPAQILDLSVWPLASRNVLLRWTFPVSIGDLERKADYMEVGVSDNFDRLTEFRFADIPSADKHTIIAVGEPGTMQSFVFEDSAAFLPKVYYFAVRACYLGNCSRPSNIVGVLTRDDAIETTPMVELPTTPEEPPYTTRSTTTTKTTARTTRPTTPTTPRETTEIPQTAPTTEEDITHWFEKPEGYITLSVFGGAILLLGICAGLYVYLRSRKDIDMSSRLMAD